MSRKTTDFIFSFSIMVVGVGLLFFGSITLGKVPQPIRAVTFQFPAAGVRAAESGGEVMLPTLPVSRPRSPKLIDAEGYAGTLTAATAVVLDDETNDVLFRKNERDTRPLASITKLMSALVLNDLPIDWATTTVITEDDADTSSHHLNVGEKFTLDDLWHAALIGSSNSAVNALVRESGITETEFVERMNTKAAALRLPSLHFVEPTGLDDGNVGNAVDVARLLREAIKVDKIYQTLHIGDFEISPIGKIEKRRVWSTDRLLTNWVPSDFGRDNIVGKTGYITTSGYNFVVRLRLTPDKAVRVAVLGATTSDGRFSEARDLAKWAFNHFAWPGDNKYPHSFEE